MKAEIECATTAMEQSMEKIKHVEMQLKESNKKVQHQGTVTYIILSMIHHIFHILCLIHVVIKICLYCY
jgi:hypothetical protein